MTTAEIAAELIRQGHSVTTYTRTKIVTINRETMKVADAVRITSIDGRTFAKSGAEGNKAGREMVGDYLSRREITQRRKAREKISKAKLTPAQLKALRIVNRLHKAKKEALERKAIIRRKNIREGRKSVNKAFRNKIRHAMHYAYGDNVQWLYEQVQTLPLPRLEEKLSHKRLWAHYFDETIHAIMNMIYAAEIAQRAGEGGLTWAQVDKDAVGLLEDDIKNNEAFNIKSLIK